MLYSPQEDSPITLKLFKYVMAGSVAILAIAFIVRSQALALLATMLFLGCVLALCAATLLRLASKVLHRIWS